jgi:hypothetical protein
LVVDVGVEAAVALGTAVVGAAPAFATLSPQAASSSRDEPDRRVAAGRTDRRARLREETVFIANPIREERGQGRKVAGRASCNSIAP